VKHVVTFIGSMVCKRMKCDKCGLKRKRLLPVSDICDHILCVVCYSSMIITSDRRCQRLNVNFFPICELCIADLKLSEEEST
jgi:hypothetical protein